MTRYVQNPDIAWRQIDGEVVLIDPSQRILRQLNEVGGEIWLGLEHGASVSDLVSRLLERFAVQKSTATAEVQDFLQGLLARGLIVTVPEGSPT